MTFKAKIYSDAPLQGSKTEVYNVNFDLIKLTLQVGVFDSEYDVMVEFDEAIGFRALDEGDLLEFWKDYNLSLAWIYEVKSGGWFELESTREDFLSKNCDFYKEFLIIGTDLCISVISKTDPIIKTVATMLDSV